MWTPEALESYGTLMGCSPICLLKGDEVIAMRAALRHIPRNLTNEDYVRWRNDWMVQILNTRSKVSEHT